MQPAVYILQQHIQRLHPLGEAPLQAMLQAWQHWHCTKEQPLLHEGSVSDYLYYVEQAAVRIFYHKHGKDIAEWLALDEQFIFSITSFSTASPASSSFIHWSHRW